MNYKLEELIDTYGEQLLRYSTVILKNRQDAEDVVQDVFLSFYQDQTRNVKNLSAWLYKVTYNRSVNMLRKRKLFIFGDISENTAAQEEVELSIDALQALDLLKPKDRALLYARIMEGYSYEELSQQMNESATALRKRYERAKKKLAKHLRLNF